MRADEGVSPSLPFSDATFLKFNMQWSEILDKKTQ